jgi:hypothetical protein
MKDDKRYGRAHGLSGIRLPAGSALYSGMGWVHDHRFFVGVLADFLTFLGGAFLAWDAFYRLRDLKSKRVSDEFRKTFPKLNLTDKEWKDALNSVRRALFGAILLVVGFFCQILLRFAE